MNNKEQLKKYQNNNFFNRKGTFEISRREIETNPEGVMLALNNVLVVSAETNFINNSVKYCGYSTYFDVLEDLLPPKYTLLFKHEGDTVIPEWHREKEYSEPDVKAMLAEILRKLEQKRS